MQFKEAKSYIFKRLTSELPKHLYYHGAWHTQDVYQAATRLAQAENVTGKDLTLLLTAVMFHDSGFVINGKEHETTSCATARDVLPQFAYQDEDIERICGMIMATRLPQTANNLYEEIICDADLDYLGRNDFFSIGKRLFREFRFMGVVKNEYDWDMLQIRFLEKHHYFTQTAINTRGAKKQEHLNFLIEKMAVKAG
jgi:predicted metal-dependent HD superfamily phosphohydrolase